MGIRCIERAPLSAWDQLLIQNGKSLNYTSWLYECDKHSRPVRFKACVYADSTDESVAEQCPECKAYAQKQKELQGAGHRVEKYLMEHVHCPADNITASFDNFEIRKNAEHEMQDKQVLNTCKYFVKPIDIYSPERKLCTVLMCGGTGAGKTFVAVATLREAVKLGYTCEYLVDSSLRSRVLGCSKARGKEENELRTYLEKLDLIVIDDVEPERWNQINSCFLATLIQVRANNLRKTLIITNRDSKAIFACFGSAVESRVKYGRILNIVGEDRRRMKVRAEYAAYG